MSRQFYRTIRGKQPVPEDFFSYELLGKPLPRDAEQQRRWRGVSAYDSIELARAIARANPRQGNFIAEIAMQFRTIGV